MHVSDDEVLYELLQANTVIILRVYTEKLCFPFTAKPGINIDFEDPSNPLEYFVLFCTPEIVLSNSQRNNQYTQTF
jgi:hypothetical protein